MSNIRSHSNNLGGGDRDTVMSKTLERTMETTRDEEIGILSMNLSDIGISQWVWVQMNLALRHMPLWFKNGCSSVRGEG